MRKQKLAAPAVSTAGFARLRPASPAKGWRGAKPFALDTYPAFWYVFARPGGTASPLVTGLSG